METVTLEEAQAHLSQLIANLKPGESLIIVQDHLPVARLIAENKPPRKLGSQSGCVTYIAEDFDAPLEDFKEYMK